ncbi:MAG: FMN-binding glutamate synthase family protein [Gammaproteobacteria bacterium]|nr:FMN-binding glutamate synthase family protein [Gammaproteobacteria bacterium]
MIVVAKVLSLFAYLFVFVVGMGVLWLVVIYIIDVTQAKHAIRRNFPVVGRFRYMFEHLGEFFRQYFFSQDREEMPFNRAERNWCYRAAKGIDTTVAFGSTRDLRKVGTVIFANTAYPTLGEDAEPAKTYTIGPDCKYPYSTRRFFHVSGMSFGAISKPAVLALSRGAKAAGCWVNTGEGGLSPYHLEGGADIVFQIGTAKYGVRKADGGLDKDKLVEVAAHDQVRMFEIKLSQGAKPGKGGILPGIKVTDEIAKIRGIPAGQDSISPNRHPEIMDAASLLDMIDQVRRVTGKPVGFKAVVGGFCWLRDIFEEINRRGVSSAPDFITVDSGDGGTGAAPQALIDNVGLPIRESLPKVIDELKAFGLRERVLVIASGKLINPVYGAAIFCAGADFIVSARGFMFALGCIQALQCNKNTCPTGVTTHDPKLQRGLVPADKAQRVERYQHEMEKEICVIAHSCGVARPRLLERRHARLVQENGLSVPMDKLYPEAGID